MNKIIKLFFLFLAFLGFYMPISALANENLNIDDLQQVISDVELFNNELSSSNSSYDYISSNDNDMQIPNGRNTLLSLTLSGNQYIVESQEDLYEAFNEISTSTQNNFEITILNSLNFSIIDTNLLNKISNFYGDGITLTIEAKNAVEFNNAVAFINKYADLNVIISLTDNIDLPNLSNIKNLSKTTLIGNGHTLKATTPKVLISVHDTDKEFNLGNPDGTDVLILDGNLLPKNEPVVAVNRNSLINMYDGVTIKNGIGTFNAAGVQVEQSSTFNMYGGTITNNESYDYGENEVSGGVTVSGNSTFNMSGGTISYNKSKYGAGISARYGQTFAGQNGPGFVNIYGGIIEYNEASENGGGIYAYYNAGIFIDGSEDSPVIIRNNKANNGGGLYVYYANVNEIDNVIMQDNEATQDGGAIYGYATLNSYYGKNVIPFTNGEMTGNSAGENGGAVKLLFSDISVSDSIISDNSAGNVGGAIFSLSSTGYANQIEIKNTAIECNNANEVGGIFIQATDLTLEDTIIINNNATSQAGGVYYPKYNSTSLTIKGSNTIQDNLVNNEQSNLFLDMDNEELPLINTLNIEGSSIGISESTPTVLKAFTTNYDTNNEGVNPNNYFTSDNPDYIVDYILNDTEARLARFNIVNFEITNGVWSDNTNTTKEVKVTRRINESTGEDDQAILDSNDIPTGMIPNPGYDNGHWLEIINTTSYIPTGTIYHYTFDLAKVDINTSINWVDESDVRRPESITIKLLANGSEIDSYDLIEADNWTKTFNDLPKYDDSNNEIIYTITQILDSKFYSETSNEKQGNTITITNTYEEPLVNVDASINWVDESDVRRPESITIKLLANGTEIDSYDLTEADNWTKTFNDLSKYDDSNNEIIYTVTQTLDSKFYSETSNEKQGNTITITNTYEEPITTIGVTLSWDDNDNENNHRPESVVVYLYANGNKIDYIELTSEDSWYSEFTELNIYDDEGIIDYSIYVEEFEYYVNEVTGSNEEGYVINSSYYPDDIGDTGEYPPQTGLELGEYSITLIKDIILIIVLLFILIKLIIYRKRITN